MSYNYLIIKNKCFKAPLFQQKVFR
jgi:hypothetical protein